MKATTEQVPPERAAGSCSNGSIRPSPPYCLAVFSTDSSEVPATSEPGRDRSPTAPAQTLKEEPEPKKPPSVMLVPLPLEKLPTPPTPPFRIWTYLDKET